MDTHTDNVAIQDNEFDGLSESESSETANGKQPTVNDSLAALLESDRLLQQTPLENSRSSAGRIHRFLESLDRTIARTTTLPRRLGVALICNLFAKDHAYTRTSRSPETFA